MYFISGGKLNIDGYLFEIFAKMYCKKWRKLRESCCLCVVTFNSEMCVSGTTRNSNNIFK